MQIERRRRAHAAREPGREERREVVAGQMEPERGAAARAPPQQPRLVGRDLDHLGALRQRRRAVAGAIVGRVRRASARGRPSPRRRRRCVQQVGCGEYVRLPKKVTGNEHAPQTSARPGLAPGGGGADAAAGEVVVVEAGARARRGAARRARSARPPSPADRRAAGPRTAAARRASSCCRRAARRRAAGRARRAAARACGMSTPPSGAGRAAAAAWVAEETRPRRAAPPPR